MLFVHLGVQSFVQKALDVPRSAYEIYLIQLGGGKGLLRELPCAPQVPLEINCSENL